MYEKFDDLKVPNSLQENEADSRISRCLLITLFSCLLNSF
jgi:hypothetical protein